MICYFCKRELPLNEKHMQLTIRLIKQDSIMKIIEHISFCMSCYRNWDPMQGILIPEIQTGKKKPQKKDN